MEYTLGRKANLPQSRFLTENCLEGGSRILASKFAFKITCIIHHYYASCISLVWCVWECVAAVALSLMSHPPSQGDSLQCTKRFFSHNNTTNSLLRLPSFSLLSVLSSSFLFNLMWFTRSPSLSPWPIDLRPLTGRSFCLSSIFHLNKMIMWLTENNLNFLFFCFKFGCVAFE